MTNKDIEAIVVRYYGAPLPGIMPALRELVAQAYEEAASEAERIWREAPNSRPEYVQNSVSHGCQASAKAIRALKNSLDQKA